MSPRLALLTLIPLSLWGCAERFDFTVPPDDASGDVVIADTELGDAPDASDGDAVGDADTGGADVPDADAPDADVDATPDTDVSTCIDDERRCEDDRWLSVCSDGDWMIEGDCLSALLCPAEAVACSCDAEGATCAVQLCEPGARRCDGQDVLECEADGQAESVLVTCDDSEICVEGGCDVSTCEVPGEVVCRGDMLLTCEADGRWSGTSCAEAEAFCDPLSLACVPWFCTPGVDTQCVSDRAEMRCDDRGAAFGPPVDCGLSAVCQDGGCQPYVCETDATRCDDEGLVLERCSGDRLSWAREAVCEPYGCEPDALPHCRVCEPDTLRCADDAHVERCDAWGEQWVAEGLCGDGERCLSGICTELVCLPESTRCVDDDPGALERCNADGTAWTVETCGGRRQVCDAGACAEVVCTPGEETCGDPIEFWGPSLDLLTCNALGTGWTTTPCGGDAQCWDDLCQPVVCEPRSAFCDPEDTQQVLECSRYGFSYIDGQTCEASEVCDAGDCVDRLCEAGQTRCDWSGGATLETCDERGLSWLQSPCPDDTICVVDACVEAICAPGATRCTDDRLAEETCNATGTGWDAAACHDAEACDPDLGLCVPGVCGDGVVQAILGEACDDGNTDPCDGCDGCEVQGTLVLSPESTTSTPGRLALDGSHFTLDFWVRTTATEGWLTGVGWFNFDHLAVGIDAGEIVVDMRFDDTTRGSMVAPVAINDGAWHHVTVQRPVTGVLGIYIDGEAAVVEALPTGGHRFDSDAVWFGTPPSAGPAYTSAAAELDDVRWSVEHTRYAGSFTPDTRLTSDDPTTLLYDFDAALSELDVVVERAAQGVGHCRGGTCGDGVVEAWERCDDGNTADRDGCSSVCEVEWGCHDEQTPVGDGSCLWLAGRGTWDTGVEVCESRDAELAMLQTPAKVLTALSLTPSDDIWLGASVVDGVVRWSDGAVIPDSHPLWARGEPDFFGDGFALFVQWDWGDPEMGQWQMRSPRGGNEWLCSTLSPIPTP